MESVIIPDPEPREIAPETFLIPNLADGGPGLLLPVNSVVIRGAEPVIVDTGAPMHHDAWIEKVFSLVDPSDVRWIFLSHDDGDHTGALLDTLEMCPNATLVTNFFSVERLALEKPALPFDRMRWVYPGEHFDAGDRTFHMFLPPIFDGPTTRGLYDSKTAFMWAVDSFVCMVPEPDALFDVNDLDRDFVDEQMPAMQSLVSPWHQFLDRSAYARHVDDVEALGVLTVATAHGPVLTGDAIGRAFDSARALAGSPIIPGPGQEVLDELVAGILAGAAA